MKDVEIANGAGQTRPARKPGKNALKGRLVTMIGVLPGRNENER